MPSISDILVGKDIVDGILAPKDTIGKALKREFGLEKFKYVFIQKVINIGIDVYIVSVDSKYPNQHISYQRVMKSFCTVFKKIKNIRKVSEPLNPKDLFALDLKGIATKVLMKVFKKRTKVDFKKVRLTPPISLDAFDTNIAGNGIIIRRDLIGDQYLQKSMYTTPTNYVI